MGNYLEDRDFTDYVHKNLAIPLIYKRLNWEVQTINNNVITNVDISNAVDRFLIDINKKKIITTQERFRDEKYANFSDFTIRYKRDFNKHEERRLSEFFKLETDYFVYGIINSSKFRRDQATDFVKFAVIDVTVIKKLFDTGYILIDENFLSYKSVEKNGKMICPVIFNKDKSSSFIPIDISILKKLFNHTNVVILSKGF